MMSRNRCRDWAVDGPDTPAGMEAKKRIPELEKIADKTDK